MLIIGSPGEVEYYLGSLVADQVGEGTWMGDGAAHLGLTGAPTAGQLRQVLHGLDPVTGQPRWASAPRRRRLGHDVVLGAPKPISIIGALGRLDVSAAVVAAHDAAVADAFGYLDRRAAWARRGSEGRLVATEGLIAAGFRHHTSRARDPHLHTHVLVANAVQDHEGAWSSLDGRWLFAEARAAGALYQSALRYYTSKAGLNLTWNVRDGGLGDVVEVPPETVREFSRRRRQIQAHLEEWSGPTWPAQPSRRADRVAQLATRPPKHGREETATAGPEAWSDRARRTGFDAGSITVSTPPPPQPPKAPPLPLLDAAAISDMLGPQGLTARSSLFTLRDLVRSVAARLIAGAPVADVEAEVERVLASPAVVQVTPETGDVVRPRSTPRYTTPELAALDERVLAQVATPTTAAVVSGEHLSSTIASRSSLGPSQVSAVIDIVSSTSAVTVLRAPAGLARNAVIEAARAAWETSGRTVLGLTPSRRDAAAFEAATGIEAIAVAEAAESDEHGLSAASVIVIDGADRLGSRVLADLIDRARGRGQRVVLVDQGRRPAVLEGRELLSRLHRAVGGPELLVEEAPDQPSRPPAAPARVVCVVHSGGTVTFTADPDGQRQAMVDDWSRRSAGTGRMVAATRSEMDDLNRRARQRLITDGRIRGPAVDVGGREYRAGEPVVIRRSAPALRLVAGQVGTVAAVDPQPRTVTIDFAGRRRPVVLAARSVGRTVLAHAYALPSRRDGHGADTFVLGAGGRGPLSGRTHVYLVASGRPGRSPLSGDRLTRLAHAGAGPTRPLSLPVDADLGQVESARSALAGDLLAGMPADVTSALISAREEVAAAAHWASGPASSGPASSSNARRRLDAERAVAQLENQAAGFDGWTQRRRPDLDRLAGLDRAIDHRRHLLGRAAEVLPDPELTAAIGPPRTDPTWRESAAAFEAYRERWGIDPQIVEPGPLDPLQQRQRDDLLRIIARIQDPLSRDREHRREVGIGLR